MMHDIVDNWQEDHCPPLFQALCSCDGIATPRHEEGLRISPKPLKINGAGEEIRTLDIDLGKVALYH